MKNRFLREGWIAFPLRTRFRRDAFALAIAILVLPLGYTAARIGIAALLGTIHKKADVRRAMAFDPKNASLYEQMGKIDQTTWKADERNAVPWLREAAQLEPANASYWESLGQACQFAGDRLCAASSFSRALALSPMAPRAQWLAANQDLLAGAADQAAAHFRRLLAMDARYAGAVFAICLRAFGTPQLVGERLLSARSSPALRLAYVTFLVRQSDFPSARSVWAGMVTTGAKFDFSAADPYLEKLISSGRIAQAARVWGDLRRLGILPASGGGDAGNRIFNPGFERTPLNAGFGWRYRNLPYVDTEFADPSAHSGARCLRIDYVVAENRGSAPAYELVPVSGGTTYRLNAWVRSQQITSDSGPRLRVIDPQHPGCLRAETPGAVGTTPWHPVSVTFSTCPQTRMIRLSVWRPRANGFPGRITGHFWIDDVALAPEGRPGPRTFRGANR